MNSHNVNIEICQPYEYSYKFLVTAGNVSASPNPSCVSGSCPRDHRLIDELVYSMVLVRLVVLYNCNRARDSIQNAIMTVLYCCIGCLIPIWITFFSFFFSPMQFANRRAGQNLASPHQLSGSSAQTLHPADCFRWCHSLPSKSCVMFSVLSVKFYTIFPSHAQGKTMNFCLLCLAKHLIYYLWAKTLFNRHLLEK